MSEAEDTAGPVSKGGEPAPQEPGRVPTIEVNGVAHDEHAVAAINGESDANGQANGESKPSDDVPDASKHESKDASKDESEAEPNDKNSKNASTDEEPAAETEAKLDEAANDAKTHARTKSDARPPVPIKDNDKTEPKTPVKGDDRDRLPAESARSSGSATPDPSRSAQRRSQRAPSIALSVSSTSSSQSTVSGMVFVKNALTTIKNSKDAKRNDALGTSVERALRAFEESHGDLPPAKVVFRPLQLACAPQITNVDLKVTALDCIAKLFTFSYIDDPEPEPRPPQEQGDGSVQIRPPPTIPLMEQAIRTVCDCFVDGATDAKVELQIIKALMNGVLSEDPMAHGATLLRAIRTVYNIFVKSQSAPNQTIAQATLTQMVNVVFERAKGFVASRDASRVNVAAGDEETLASAEVAEDGSQAKDANGEDESKANGNQLTLEMMRQKSADDDDDTIRGSAPTADDTSRDLVVKDAFLVFRTLCKLSEKPIEGDPLDMRSHGMRSKLLSLHLIHTILKAHMNVFLSPSLTIRSNKGEDSFLYSVKDYINSSLVRNAPSASPAVFEISAEIFWLIVSNLRGQFKPEIQVFFKEIYFLMLELPTSSLHQKLFLLSIFERLCNDPRALVELYLNYDCDRNSTLNVYEHLIDDLVRIAVTPVPMTQMQLQQFHAERHRRIAVYNLNSPPALSISHLQNHKGRDDAAQQTVQEYLMKIMALECLLAALRSMLTWSQRGIAAVLADDHESSANSSTVDASSRTALSSANTGAPPSPNPGHVTPATDDPSQFESFKHRKTALSDAIREFNFKPKRGIQKLIDNGFIPKDDPVDIAKFLLYTEGLDKATIGEYLGGEEPRNIAIMHAFVDLMDFSNSFFVDALRNFLQAFRLPGESQKIDRYMLKFAERYTSGNPGVFANADTAYVLAYSTIMLNTDQHSPQVKRRMTLDDFVKNNRGINDGADVPLEFLAKVFNEIVNNEIKLNSEQQAALLSGSLTTTSNGGLFGFGLGLAAVGRDLQREAYMLASREMSNKTEELFRNLMGRKTGEVFYNASHIEHVKPMFEVVWMSFLAGLSGPYQESDEPGVVKLCLEGLRLATRIACLFDLDLPRESLVSALSKFANHVNLAEMKLKHVEAIKVILSIALSEGNSLRSSWKDVLTTVSQIERLQLIASGISSSSLPDVMAARIARPSTDGRRSMAQHVRPAFGGHFTPEVAEAFKAGELVVDMDKIFTQSAKLSGDGINSFVRALAEVSLEEIRSSGQTEAPRMFSLQKMVDVSYYNMGRIRVEWAQLWSIMGEQFTQVGCLDNQTIVVFALDSLRQLAMRFFEIEELPHFKFQKDFLRPFEYIMRNNPDQFTKDYVLQCLDRMILSRAHLIKSGWSAMFAVFNAGANVPYASIVKTTFELTRKVYDDYLGDVIRQGGFRDLMSCLGELAKNPRYQKTSLQAIDLLKKTIPRISELEKEYPDEGEQADAFDRFWYPILMALHSVIMDGEDLEVRSTALNYMFDTLTEYGGQFESSFWDHVCRKLLFPIFTVLKNRSETNDDVSIWLSTTMIQALRNMIALLTYYFDTLERMLEGFLELLVTCIDQDNDTVSRIGASCLLQLVVENVTKLTPAHWALIVDKIESLFETTTAHELLDGSLIRESTAEAESSTDSVDGANGNANGSKTTAYLKRPAPFRKTIVKCVLQLLMIETVGELLEREEVQKHLPTTDVLRISKRLRASYLFAKKFNGDRDTRRRLHQLGFMQQPPNLLKQQWTAAMTYVQILFRLYRDHAKLESEPEERKNVETELVTTTCDIIRDYNQLDSGERRAMETSWPIVHVILKEYYEFDDADFKANLPSYYPHIVGILGRDVVAELRIMLQQVLVRIGEVAIL